MHVIVCLHQGCTDPGHLVTQTTIFFTVAHGIFIIILADFFPLLTKMSIRSCAPSRKCQITARVTGCSRILGPQYGTLCLSSFWCLQLEVTTRFLGKFLYPLSILRTMNILYNLVQTCQMCLKHQSYLITLFNIHDF